jgi:hypothetical protein
MKQVAKGTKQELRGLQLDEWDHTNLEGLIRTYNEAFKPGMVKVSDDNKYIEYLNLADHMKVVRKDIKIERKLRHASGDKTGFQIRSSFPPTFVQLLSKGYPTLLNDEKQLDKFLRWFPEFDLLK